MSNVEELCSGQLLRDIEEISHGLYLEKGPSRALIPKPQFESDSRAVVQNVFQKTKKSLIWRWNPLKSLTHFRSHRFNCLFFLHVHSVEGLGSNFNDLALRVSWKRKDEVFRTHPVRVIQGVAEFEETLMHQCPVYVSRNGPQNSLEYEPKLFLLQALVIGAPMLDIGKHWVDLTRLLPLTFEELEEEKRTTGKWTTSFKLKGKAKGATLNVSFGFLVMGDDKFDRSHIMKVSDIIRVSGHSTMHPPPDNTQIASVSSARKRLGSISRKSLDKFHHVSSQSLDMRLLREVSSNQKSELSRSITFLYQKFDEEKFSDLNVFDSIDENLVPYKSKSTSLTETVCRDLEEELEDIDFTVIDQGIELPVKDELKRDRDHDHDHDISQVGQESVSHIADSAGAEDSGSLSENGDPNLEYELDFDSLFGNARDNKYESGDEFVEKSSGDEPQTVPHDFLASKSVDLNSSLNTCQFMEQEENMGSERSQRAGMMGRSLSFDDATNFLANKFLDIFGTEHYVRDMSSESEPESPRERLLRQFEKEYGDSVLNLDAVAEQMEVGGVSRTGSGWLACHDDFDLSLAIQEAEKEHDHIAQSLRSRRNARMLENLETETLMQKWGLNENSFQYSPQIISGGFGSPIYVPNEEPSVLPPLGEGLGPLLQTNGGGILRSMNSSHFKRAKNDAKLIMQVSNQVVLPLTMGSSVMDILQCWASGGAENMLTEANKMLPLQDITGKTMQQLSLENECSGSVLNRFGKWGSLDDCKVRNSEPQAVHSAQSLSSSFVLENLHSEYVSLEGLVPFALAHIEALSIEGLRIQSGLSYEEAPSSIRLQFNNENIFNKLMRLSISLDEWIKIDGLGSDCEGEVDEHLLKVLEAHHTNILNFECEQPTTSGSGCGLFGNNFSMALRLLLRDPLRDYEMVGEPMLVLFQVEKVPPHQDEQSDMNEATSFRESSKKMDSGVLPLYRISDIHIAGLNFVPNRRAMIPGKHNKSGARWLLSSGMDKTSKRPVSKSDAILKLSSELLRKGDEDILWSISSLVQQASNWKELAGLNFHVRNPDIILPSS